MTVTTPGIMGQNSGAIYLIDLQRGLLTLHLFLITFKGRKKKKKKPGLLDTHNFCILHSPFVMTIFLTVFNTIRILMVQGSISILSPI